MLSMDTSIGAWDVIYDPFVLVPIAIFLSGLVSCVKHIIDQGPLKHMCMCIHSVVDLLERL